MKNLLTEIEIDYHCTFIGSLLCLQDHTYLINNVNYNFMQLHHKVRQYFYIDELNSRSVKGVFTADNARRRLAQLAGSVAEPLDNFTVKRLYRADLARQPAPTLGLVSRMLDIAPFVLIVKTGK